MLCTRKQTRVITGQPSRARATDGRSDGLSHRSAIAAVFSPPKKKNSPWRQTGGGCRGLSGPSPSISLKARCWSVSSSERA